MNDEEDNWIEAHGAKVAFASGLVLVVLAIVALFSTFGQHKHHEWSGDPLYCDVTGCGEFGFGSWYRAHSLVFADLKGVVNYEYAVTKCRKVYQREEVYVNKGWVKVGHFRRLVQRKHVKHTDAGTECRLKKNGQLISALPFMGYVANQFQDSTSFASEQMAGFDGAVPNGSYSDLPDQYEVLR